MIRRVTRHILFFTCLTAGAAHAAELRDIRFPAENWDPKVLAIYDAGTSIIATDTVFELNPPPANDSDAVQAELDYQRGLKPQRTNEQVEKILAENRPDHRLYNDFLAVGGYVAEDYPRTLSLLDMTLSETAYFVYREKQKFQRPRPSQLTDDLDLVIPNPGHAAYPSGHAAQSQALALVMAKLDPAHADAYKALARDIAWRRELAGVHFPSDSAAGHKMAGQIVAALMESDYFAALFAKAQKEFS